MVTARGRAFQKLVSEVARAFDSDAVVTEGEWVPGPDGRLDMDVAIRGYIEARPVLVVVECKDFSLSATGKVGREFVDALDAKRHDLGATVAIICSNSGFTADALRKAKRKGIGMISVLREGDDRVKAEIQEELILRCIYFGDWRFTYHSETNIAEALESHHLHSVKFGARSLDAWLQYRAFLVAKENPSVNTRLRASFRFTKPLAFCCGANPITLSGAEVGFIYRTEWRRQTIRLDATLGIYDYLRGRSTCSGENQYMINGVDWDTADPCELPSDWTPVPTALLPGEMIVEIVIVDGMDLAVSISLPDLERHVLPEDLLCNIVP
ncbi:MAG: DUF2034 domain-containing protein [Proteobacteria bacterium]|nr:DUF2034 domain-containing protein [Pseudomonadota bacterium]